MNRKSLWTRLLRSSRGQSLIEFGMVLPFLLVVGFAITEFGRALWTQNVLTEAAGAGARAAMMADPNTYQTKAQDAADHCLIANKMGTAQGGGAVVAADLITDTNGNPCVRVKVTRDFSFIPGSGGGGGLLTAPFGGKSNTIALGTFTIAGVAIAKQEGKGWGNAGP
jgi:Flp pilus assembly protein TadG